MIQVLRAVAMNAAVFSLAALPLGIASAGVLNAPPDFWNWPFGQKAAAFLYVWSSSMGLFSLGFLAHQIGMAILAWSRPALGSRAIVLLTTPLLFLWLLIPGIDFNQVPWHAPATVLPFALATAVYGLFARPIAASSTSEGPPR